MFSLKHSAPITKSINYFSAGCEGLWSSFKWSFSIWAAGSNSAPCWCSLTLVADEAGPAGSTVAAVPLLATHPIDAVVAAQTAVVPEGAVQTHWRRNNRSHWSAGGGDSLLWKTSGWMLCSNYPTYTHSVQSHSLIVHFGSYLLLLRWFFFKNHIFIVLIQNKINSSDWWNTLQFKKKYEHN